MKKKSLIAIAAGLVLVIALGGGLFWYYHPTHYRFNDRFVLGSTQEEIVARYGEPYSNGNGCMIYQIREDTPEWIMGYDNSLWYEIYFEEGKAVRVALQEGQRGG